MRIGGKRRQAFPFGRKDLKVLQTSYQRGLVTLKKTVQTTLSEFCGNTTYLVSRKHNSSTPGQIRGFDAQISSSKGPKIMGILATPPKATPPKNKALLRAY